MALSENELQKRLEVHPSIAPLIISTTLSKSMHKLRKEEQRAVTLQEIKNKQTISESTFEDDQTLELKEQETATFTQKEILSDRPLEVIAAINKAFNYVSNNGMEIYGSDGSAKDYKIAGVTNTAFITSMLKRYSDQGKTSFSFMDVGGGKHGCARYIARYINENKDIFPNIKQVEIISLSGDNALPSQRTEGICRISEISRFKIEEIGRWLHPSDALIKTYEKIEAETLLCRKVMLKIEEIERWANQFTPLIIGKVIESNFHDIYRSEILDDGEREIANVELNHSRIEFKRLSEEYELISKEFYEQYGIEVDIYPKNVTEVLSPEKLCKDLLSSLYKSKKIVCNLNPEIKFQLNANRELETLRIIKRMNLPVKIDYATSALCTMHLMDPVGMLIQVHNLLTPGGVFHCDGYFKPAYAYHKGVDLFNIDEGFYKPMLRLLHSLKIPYVLDKFGSVRCAEHMKYFGRMGDFIIVRTMQDSLPVEPSFRYHLTQGEISLEVDDSWLSIDRNITAGLFNDQIAKYEGWVGDIALLSPETALLLATLKHEGISFGCTKITDYQYEDLFKAVSEEYPKTADFEGVLQGITARYTLYDVVKNGTLEELQRLIAANPMIPSRHLLFAAAENNRVEQFTMLIKLCEEAPRDVMPLTLLESIKAESLRRATKNAASTIVQLLTAKQDNAVGIDDKRSSPPSAFHAKQTIAKIKERQEVARAAAQRAAIAAKNATQLASKVEIVVAKARSKVNESLPEGQKIPAPPPPLNKP